jgi:hypothetical protein
MGSSSDDRPYTGHALMIDLMIDQGMAPPREAVVE